MKGFLTFPSRRPMYAGMTMLLGTSTNIKRDVGLFQAAMGLGYIVCHYLYMQPSLFAYLSMPFPIDPLSLIFIPHVLPCPLLYCAV